MNMKKAACQGDLVMANNPEAILGQPQSQAVLDIDRVCLGHCVTAKSGAQSQSTPEDSSDSVASSGDETAKGDLSLSLTQVLNADPGEAKRQPTQKTALDKASGGFDASEAAQFLELLCKDNAATWLRCIKPGRNGASEHQGLDSRWINSKTAAGFNLYAVIGNATAATGKGGGVQDTDITGVPALFVEWDDGATIDEQMQRWQSLGLPEPSVMVSTGGKSVHCYWVLLEPISSEQWKQITARLIAHCNSDKACSNPSRVMRLPGSIYHDKKTGEPTGQCSILSISGARYAAFDIEGCLPAPSPAKPVTAAPSRQFEPRPEAELIDALRQVPVFAHGEGRREELLGLAFRLAAELGADRGLQLMQEHSPDVDDLADYFKTEPDRISAGSIWPFMREHYGIDISRSRTSNTAKPVNSNSRPKPKAERKARHLSHTKAMACFDRCVEIQSKRERNSLRRRARLLAAAKALGIAAYVNRAEIAQRVLEAKDQQQGHCFQLLNAADRLAIKAPSVVWLIRDMLPAGDLTIIGGRPKVGKTRLAVAIAAAVLNGGDCLGFGAASPRPVVLVTDDQADGDTYSMLQALRVWDHPNLHWSHHFRFTESDIEALLAAIKANPGALVVMDSLRSVSRSLPTGENDPEIGAYLYDLKQAVIDAGGSLLLIHHCNKAADLVGVEALSGHNAIAGAANTVLTMHYMPDANGKPDKTNQQRRLVREARSGEGCDVVIDRGAGAGTYRQVSSFDQWQKQLEDAKEASKLDNLNTTQEQALKALSNEWETRRQVCEAIGVEWGDRGRNPDAQRTNRALKRLVELGAAESKRDGVEATYRLASHEAQNEVMTLMTSMPPSEANGSHCHHSTDDSDDIDATQSGTERHQCHHLPDDGDDIEKPLHNREASVSSVSSPASDPQRQENEQRIRELGRSADLSGWPDDEVAELRQSLEQVAKRRASGFAIPVQEAA
jgi:hypothetical protein